MEQPASPNLLHPFRWLPEFFQLSRQRLRSQGRVLGGAIVVGLVAGLGAVLFAVAVHVVTHYCLGELAGYQPVPPAGEARLPGLQATATPLQPWLLVLIPMVGGLVSGWIVFKFAPEAEGHGTDAAIAAYHFHDGLIRPRVPLIKLVASAITLGTGGSGGREGPIALIGAGFGSLLSRLIHLRPAERRILVAAGMGAGVAAIFRAPLAGALFAAEVLYSSPEFESDVILPAALASVVSYCTFGVFFDNWEPLFKTPELSLDTPWQLIPYLGLALFVALLAMLYTRTFYGMTHLFRRWRIPAMYKPAVGALATGLVGVGLYYTLRNETALAVMSAGYGVLQEGMTKTATGLTLALVLLVVALGKIVTTSLTIGSGGSGGVFGPSMVIGGCAGGAFGLVLQHYFPLLVPHPQSFILLGMAGFFAAAAKTPFSTLIIVSEMTGDYKLLLPALWVCATAFLLSDEQSLYSQQVSGRARSPAHQGSYIREVLAGLLVQQFLGAAEKVPSVRPDDTLSTVLDRLDDIHAPVLPVTDATGKLLGVVNLEEVHVAAQSPHLRPWLVAADLMRANVEPLTPDDRLDRALELFAENDLPALPVVVGDGTRKLVGLVRRSEVARAYLQRVHGRAEADGVAAEVKE